MKRRSNKAPSESKAEPEAAPPLPGIGHNGAPVPIEIDLPLPTSTNRIWRRGHSRGTGRTWTYLSKSYQTWKDKASQALEAQQPPGGFSKISGPFEVTLVITRAKRFKIDIDNRIKAPLDWAKQAGLIEDDKHQNRVVLEWGRAPMGARLTLTPVEIDA